MRSLLEVTGWLVRLGTFGFAVWIIHAIVS
jgi:hypothetical protein